MESSLNNFVGNLSDAETWLGARELIPHGTGTLSLNLSSATDLVLTISQSLDGSNFVWTDNFNHVFSIFGSVTRTQIPVKGSFAKVSLLNVSGGPATNVILSTFFSPNGIDATIEQPSRIAGSVDVLNGMKATEKVFNTLREVACDDDGKLIVIATPTGTQDVNIVSSITLTETNSADIKVAVDSLDGKVVVCNTGDVAGSVSVIGQEPQHTFYASAGTNIPAVYADGVQGTNVNGGWQYVNTGVGSNKINWYLYGNTAEQGATAKKIKDIDFMYAVIDQKTTLGLAQGQNPFFIFYSLPDSGTNALWYKSKFFYGSNAHTDVLGVKLLYIGTDVATIHPEITGINRIQLEFVPAQSTKTIEQGAEELLWLGSLQTTGSPQPVAGAFNFVFSEYGINFAEEALNPTILPIIANKVQADVTGSAVEISTALPTGTNRIGEVITREDPASVSNLTGLNATSQQIKASPGSLMNLTAFNDGNAISYIKIYNSLTATNADTPVMTLPIRHDSPIYTINNHNLQFSTGICVRATAGYASNDNTAPNGTTSLVAFFNGVF